jgi:hypothetical protein
MGSESLSRRRLSFLATVSAIAAAACGSSGGGGTPTQPTARAVLQVTASPTPAPLAACSPDHCPSGPPQYEVLATLSVRETGGVGGRLTNVALTWRRNSDNVVVLTTTLSPASLQVAFAANGTVTTELAFHHDQADLTAPSTVTMVLNATDDRGAAVSSTVTLPVNGPPTRAGLFITGNYQIAQATLTNTCGDTAAPPSVTGWVTLTGPDSFQLRDTGGTTFTGMVGGDGRFVATAVFGPDPSGQTFTQRLEGTFSGNEFTGTLSVSVQPRNCAFTRTWTATRLT